MLNPEHGRVDPNLIDGPLGIHLGRLFLKHGFFSEKGGTPDNIQRVRELIVNEGVVFLNDHRDFFGIVVAGAHIAEHIRIDTLKGPGALTILEGTLYRWPLKYIREHPGVEAIPVARAEEKRKAKKRGKYKGRTLEELEQMNQEYLTKVRDIRNEPNTAMVVALFGSRNTYGKKDKVRRGVVEILQSGAVYVPTFSEKVKNGTILPSYEIHIGEPDSFNEGENSDVIRNTLVKKYFDLEQFAKSI